MKRVHYVIRLRVRFGTHTNERPEWFAGVYRWNRSRYDVISVRRNCFNGTQRNLSDQFHDLKTGWLVTLNI
ncbi:hypothetical protein PUN28_008530 [Cardiocondyla obscurior]|uniref:Uncharacterized protein n=1 Tax=Cardiocondyla obscurior TaxID=286306 RepID=A0AAW2G3B0_9HYME